MLADEKPKKSRIISVRLRSFASGYNHVPEVAGGLIEEDPFPFQMTTPPRWSHSYDVTATPDVAISAIVWLARVFPCVIIGIWASSGCHELGQAPSLTVLCVAPSTAAELMACSQRSYTQRKPGSERHDFAYSGAAGHSRYDAV